MPRLFVHRTVDVEPGISLELRVPLGTALAWAPQYARREPLLRSVAEGRAVQEAADLVRRKGIDAGSWLVTWAGTVAALEPR